MPPRSAFVGSRRVLYITAESSDSPDSSTFSANSSTSSTNSSTSSANSSTSPADMDQHKYDHLMSCAKRMVKDVIYPLKKKHPEPYISKEHLKKLGIVCTHLDFNTGKPSKGEQFIRPIPQAQMHQWLQDSRPWEIRRDIAFDPHGLGQNPFHESSFVECLISVWLNCAQEGAGPEIMRTHTRWEEFSCDSPNLMNIRNGNMDWQVQGSLRRIKPRVPSQATTYDLSKPHVMGFLASNNLLREDVFSTGEVIAILFMSCAQVVVRDLAHHRVIPVTLISGSHKSVRIIQGNVDVRRGTMEIRKSPIINFDNGMMKNYPEFVTLLGWMIGDPVGKTT